MDKVLIDKKLHRLRLQGIAAFLEHRLCQALEEKWSYSMFLENLLTDEIDRRENRLLTLRLGKSRLDTKKTMENFDFKFNSKLHVSLIRELTLCGFVEKKQNIFVLGPSGVGKSHLAQALGHEACRRGFEVLFFDTYQLLEWIYSGRGDGTYKKRLAKVCNVPILILDDFGLQGLDESQQNDLYHIIVQRYEKSSTIITRNRDFDEWPSIFANPLIGTAALDRLVHKGIQIIIEGASYRLAEFKKSCAKPRDMTTSQGDI
jgi:DNA replication protein DnaC